MMSQQFGVTCFLRNKIWVFIFFFAKTRVNRGAAKYSFLVLSRSSNVTILSYSTLNDF